MSKTVDIRVPDIGDFVKVPVIEILAQPGDAIEAEESLITLESDKATMEVPAPHSGTLVTLTVKEGDELSEGDVIGSMEITEDADAADDDAADDATPAPQADSPKADEAVDAPAEATPPSEPAPAPTSQPPAAPSQPFAELSTPAHQTPHAAPGVRKLARELGISLAGIAGTGRKGRITDEDLAGAIKAQSAGGGVGGLELASAPEVDFASFGPVETVALSRIKKISGPALHRNWVSIPHVTHNLAKPTSPTWKTSGKPKKTPPLRPVPR
jgi:pyruvate dehydrogenase E2 component (dihydrolipoamide acetyltransferase)